MMTGDEFHALGMRVWGRGYQARIAAALGVADRQVRRWRSGDTPIPPGVEAEIRALATSAEEQQRLEEDAYARLAPRIDALVSEMRDTLHPADVLGAILNRTVELMRDGAGVPATIEMLREAIRALRSEERQ